MYTVLNSFVQLGFLLVLTFVIPFVWFWFWKVVFVGQYNATSKRRHYWISLYKTMVANVSVLMVYCLYGIFAVTVSFGVTFLIAFLILVFKL